MEQLAQLIVVDEGFLADVHDRQLPVLEYTSVNYLWQIRSVGGRWTDTGGNASTLSISSAAKTLDGTEYRCIANAVTSDGDEVPYYSKPVTLTVGHTDLSLTASSTWTSGSGTLDAPYYGRANFTTSTVTDSSVNVPTQVTAMNGTTSLTLYKVAKTGGYEDYYFGVSADGSAYKVSGGTLSGTALTGATITTLTKSDTKKYSKNADRSSPDLTLVDQDEILSKTVNGTEYFEAVAVTGGLTGTVTAITPYWYTYDDTNGFTYYADSSGVPGASVTTVALYGLDTSKTPLYSVLNKTVNGSNYTYFIRTETLDSESNTVTAYYLVAYLASAYSSTRYYLASESTAYSYTYTPEGSTTSATVTITDPVLTAYTIGVKTTTSTTTYTDHDGQKFTFTGTAKKDSAALKGISLRAEITNMTTGAIITITASAVTDASGNATFEWTPPTAGLYVIKVTSLPTGSYSAGASNTLYFYAGGDGNTEYRMKLTDANSNTLTDSVPFGSTVNLALTQRTVTLDTDGTVKSVSAAEDYTGTAAYKVSYAGGSETAVTGTSSLLDKAGLYKFSAYNGTTLLATAYINAAKKAVTVTPTWTGDVPSSLSAVSLTSDPTVTDTLSDYISISSPYFNAAGTATGKSGTYSVSLSSKQDQLSEQFFANYDLTYVNRSFTVAAQSVPVVYSAGENGSVAGRAGANLTAFASGSSVTYGQQLRFDPTPVSGYVVEKWAIEGTEYPLTVTQNGTAISYEAASLPAGWTINKTTGALTLAAASFTAKSGGTDGTLTVSAGFSNATHTITFAVSGTGGSLTAATAGGNTVASGAKVINGASVTFTAVPESGRSVSSWTVDGATYKFANGNTYAENTLTLTGISADTTVNVAFSATRTFTVSASACDSAGTAVAGASVSAKYLSGSALTLPADVASGSSVTFTVSLPDAGNQTVREWQTSTDNGVTWVTASGSGGSVIFTKNDITKNTNVRAILSTAQKYTVTYTVKMADGSAAPTGVTLSAADGAGTAIASGSSQGAYIPVNFTLILPTGYRVDNWKMNGNAVAGRQASASGETWQLASLTQNVTIAITLETYKFTYGVQTANPAAPETLAVTAVTSGSTQTWNLASGSTLTSDCTVTLKLAGVASGYRFAGWYVNGVLQSETGLTLTYSAVAGTDISVQARVVRLSYAVAYGGSHGTVTGVVVGGSAIDASPAQIVGDTQVVFTAAPDAGYELAYWTVNGQKGSATGDLTQTITDAVTIRAVFQPKAESYTVNFSAEGSGTIVNNANISTGDTVANLTSITFTATPDAGQHIEGWYLNGSKVAGSGDTAGYTISVTANSSVTVKFEAVPTYDLTVSAVGDGSVAAAVNGTVQAITGGKLTVTRGDSVQLTATPETGNRLASWTLDGADKGNGFTLSLANVSAAHTVTANFAAVARVTVKATAEANGSISAAAGYGSTLTALTDLSSGTLVTTGKKVVFTAVPDSGYMVSQWTVNGTVQDNVSDTLTIDNLSVGTTVTVAFETQTLFDLPGDGTDYTVAVVSRNPSTPGTANQIRKGGTAAVKITPASGKYIMKVECSGCTCSASANSDGTWTAALANITAAPALNVTFGSIPVTYDQPENGTLTVKYGTDTIMSGGSVIPGAVLVITASPASGYSLGTLTVNSKSNTGSYTVLDTDTSVVIAAAFVQNSLPAPGPGGDTFITVPVTGDTAVVDVKATVADKTVTVAAPSDAELETVTNKAAAASVPVKIDMSSLDGENTTAVIPAKTVTAVAGSKAAGLEISMPAGQTLTFDAKSLSTLTSAGSGDLKVSVDQVDEKTLPTEQQNYVKSGDIVLNLTAYEGNTQVHDFAGGTVKVGIPYDGIRHDGMKVWRIVTAENGSVSLEAMNAVYNSVTKCYEFDTGKFSEYALVYFPFTDVPNNAWYYEYAAYAYKKELMLGNGTLFTPENAITRAMIVMTLYRLDGSPAVTGSVPFSDVKTSDWYYSAVVWGVENGIVKGYDDGTFRGDSSVLRQDMVSFMYRYAAYKGCNISSGTTTDISSFADAGNVPAHALTAIKWSVGDGIVIGSGGKLLPGATGRRCEYAAILERFAKMINS